MSGLIRGKEAITPTITFAPRKAKQCALDAMRRRLVPALLGSTHRRYELRIPCSVQPKLGVGRPPVEAFLTVSPRALLPQRRANARALTLTDCEKEKKETTRQ